MPSARRCYKLGQALRRAIESYPEDLDVAIVATGGLSHQVHGERCGFNNTPWDMEFLDLIERDPERLAGFVYGTARNVLNNYLRTRSRLPKEDPIDDALNLAQPPARVDDSERMGLVRRALTFLEPTDRQILLLTLVEGLKP